VRYVLPHAHHVYKIHITAVKIRAHSAGQKHRSISVFTSRFEDAESSLVAFLSPGQSLIRCVHSNRTIAAVLQSCAPCEYEVIGKSIPESWGDRFPKEPEIFERVLPGTPF
jgi:hypothetical protein